MRQRDGYRHRHKDSEINMYRDRARDKEIEAKRQRKECQRHKTERKGQRDKDKLRLSCVNLKLSMIGQWHLTTNHISWAYIFY